MRVALAQMNSCLGDFSGNIEKVLSLSHEAVEKRCDLIVFPELNIFGYHPCDLLERPSVVDEQNKMITELVSQLPTELNVLLGAVTHNHGRGKLYYNSALWIHQGAVQKVFNKELLPVYDVFDDSRHFSSGKMADNSIDVNSKKIQILICEDMWGWDELHQTNPLISLNKNDYDLVVNLSASPFTLEKREQRLDYAKKTAHHLEAPLVYVNMVGAQDELIFDGGSFAISQKGDMLAQSAYFVEDLNIVDLNSEEGGVRKTPQNPIDFLHQALVLGIRDFVQKIGMKKAHVGLSGGIDSAVIACLIADAIGPQNLTCIALPTRFNSDLSFNLAKQLCENIHCHFFELPIQTAFETLIQSYESCFGKKEFSLLHENLQARLRGDFLMAYSNENNSLLITTGNKSEYATGYATLYGDMCGGLAPIADLLKEQVYAVARFYNKEHEMIPEEIITRAPSAELRDNQKDSDSLPDYDKLDRAVEKLVCKKESPESDVENWVLQQLYRSEFKRWQAPPILKISDHAFGQGRRMPIAHRAKA